jgi:hypothetical protein
MFEIFEVYIERFLRCGSSVTRLLGLRLRILPEHGCISLVSVVCCVLCVVCCVLCVVRLKSLQRVDQ